MKLSNIVPIVAIGLSFLAVTGSPAQTVVFQDDFSGNEGTTSSVTTPSNTSPGDYYGGFSLDSGTTTYSAYVGQNAEDSSVYSLADTADAGPNGDAALVFSLSPTTGQEFSGFNSGGVATTFTRGAITVADLQSLQISYDLTLAGPYGSAFYLNAANESGATYSGPQLFNFTPGGALDTGGNFQHVVFDLSTESNATLQSFADSLNSEDSNMLVLQIASTFNNNDTGTESETIANLTVTELPEPGAWAMVGMGMLALVVVGRFRRNFAI